MALTMTALLLRLRLRCAARCSLPAPARRPAGHRAFSDNIALGDAVGMVLHSALLVPYHPWRISHAKHHKNTNSMERDEVFVPYTREDMDGNPSDADHFSGPVEFVVRVAQICTMLLFGWPA